MRPDTLHLSQSVGKSVLGLLVGVLPLDPATPVTEHVPEVAGSGYDGATVQHLLDMTAAIDFVEDYETFWRYDVACAWHPPHPVRARRDDPRVPADDRARRLAARRAPALLDAEHRPARARRGARGRGAAGRADRARAVGAARCRARRAGDGRHGGDGRDRRRLLRHPARLRAARRARAPRRRRRRARPSGSRGSALGDDGRVRPRHPSRPRGASGYGLQWWRIDGRPVAARHPRAARGGGPRGRRRGRDPLLLARGHALRAGARAASRSSRASARSSVPDSAGRRSRL